MILGKYRQAIILFFLLAPSAVAFNQPVKRFTYIFNEGQDKNSISVSENSIIIDYSLSELDIENIRQDTGQFFRITIPGHIPTSDPGKPELPVLSRLITIPEGQTFSVRISGVETTRIKPASRKIEGLLLPAQEGETKEIQDHKPRFVMDKTVYSSRDFLKTDTVKIIPLGRVRQKDLATVYISPVQYNPRTNVLEIITSMKIEITFSAKGSTGITKQGTESSLFTETLVKGILNYGPEDLITGFSDKPVRMVILTDTTFKKNLQPLIKWKTQKGFKIEILYRGTKYAGDTYTAIKNTLTNLYNASGESNPAPDYLLIVGDVSKIPYYGTGQVTDLYYGEFDGNGDYIPEMFIGRLPVADTNELKTVVSKIIQYEKFEFAGTNKFYSNAIMPTGSDGSYSSYINGQVKYAITNYLTPANKIKESHFYYPYNPPSSFAATQKDSVIKLVNKGTSFINYSGHGDAAGWLTLNIKVADTAKFLNRNMYPFIISNACNTAQYNLANSFGNRMVVSKNKGAVGFIGCSNSSYWDEDFYWAVGLGTPSADPKYENTGLGALDRLFHTHGEPASDWYITLGQINYAGNLAVSASTSSRKKYYWETYNVLGDPSMIPIIGTPDTFNIVLPDTLPNGIRSYSIITDRFIYAAVSHDDILWDASFASPSGSVTLDMPGLSNDSCLFVITGQNKKPLIKTIHFSGINSEFINLTKSELNDSLENNNGLADFGETIFLKLRISNLGKTGTGNLYAKIKTTSDWVTLNKDSAFIGSLGAGSEFLLRNKLSFILDENVPDGGLFTIELILKDDAVEKHYNIDIKTHAPKLSILSYQIKDSPSGNGDFIPDPGERLQLVFFVSNEGSSSTSGQFNISTSSPDLNILESSIKSGELKFGKTVQIPVMVDLAETLYTGATISFSVELNCPPYLVRKNFSFRIGQIRESFESSSFRTFPWINRSAKPWIITSTGAYDGNISARSGVIPDNSSSSLIIRTFYPAGDSIKFFYKVSSEQNYDYLIFRINDVEVFKKSGETAWEKKAISVPSGYKKFEWIYKKDAGIQRGSDCAWIDMIDFAATGSVRYIKKDITPARIVTPVQKESIGKEIVTVKMLNVGPDTVKGFNLAFSINKAIPVKQFFPATLIPFGDSVSVTFTTRADFSRYGLYDFTLYGTDNGDDYPVNDTINKKFEHTTIDEPLLAFPNPFKTELNIIINSQVNGTAHITLTNQAGKKIYDFEKDIIKGENTVHINDRNLAASVYYLRVEFPGIVKVIPVVKTRD
jgi:hypothetical protein